MAFAFDLSMWRKFNLIIDLDVHFEFGDSILLRSGYMLTQLKSTDMSELSSVLRAVVLSKVLVHPQPAFLAVIATLLSGCPTSFQN